MPVNPYGDFASNMANFDNITSRAKNAASNQRALASNKQAIDSTKSLTKQYNSALAKIVLGKSKTFKGTSSTFGTSSGGGSSVGGSKFNRFMNAVRQQESGGNYGAGNSIGATGAYQVMPANIPSWTREALGKSVSRSKFRSSKSIQDKVASHFLNKYVKKYGYGGAAAAWYGGPGAGAKYSRGVRNNSNQRGGPSIANYVKQVLARM